MEVIMWIARDADGNLFMFGNKPEKEGLIWISSDFDLMGLRSTLFPEVKWSDPEPTKVQIKIIK